LTKNYPGKFNYFAFEYGQSNEAKYLTVEETYLVNKLLVFEKDYSLAKGVKQKIKSFLFKIFPDRWVVKLNDAYNNTRPIPPESVANDGNLANKAILDFPRGSSILSVGADFMQNKMMADLARKKEALNLKILLMCYDMIPVLYPESCVSEIVANFPIWLNLIGTVADEVLCISTNTKNDLYKYLVENHLPIPKLTVVQLGDNAASQIQEDLVSPQISKLVSKKYLLFVSTIEPRKNHKVLLEAYNLLLSQKVKGLPQLYFVGGTGWKNSDLKDTIDNRSELNKYVKILNHVTDVDLVTLYKHCMFTLYPSLYEGWGLPIRESLCNGKFCLCSSSSSLPEAGGRFVEYIPPEDAKMWAKRLHYYISHTEILLEKENIIRNSYKSASWDDFGIQILNSLPIHAQKL
jgi:glycosyltransferase involved in cell wall biosynthesis